MLGLVQSPLDNFSPPVREWFTAAYGEPTPPQAEAWPHIQRGEHTLILAPTGSGKTLAAFLWGIDDLLRELGAGPNEDIEPTVGAVAAGGAGPTGDRRAGDRRAGDRRAGDRRTGDRRTGGGATRPVAAHSDQGAAAGIRLLYISPLKALNNDIQRNLRVPLAGIRRHAHESGVDLPEIRVAVRSGDTPARERRGLLAKPPHILITTPESLYLLLTGPRAREVFRTLRTVIVDEIHTMAGTKRGVHLTVSLERLGRAAATPVQRIGLSATIRPLDEVARFLGGSEWVGDDSPTGRHLSPRPVTIVDAGYRKPLDLLVETVVDDPRGSPGGSVWPAIIARVSELMRTHTTTLVFANGRRLAERTADRLNEQVAAEAAWREAVGGHGASSGAPETAAPPTGAARAPVVAGEPDPVGPPALLTAGSGFTAAGRGLPPPPGRELIRAHHGSMSREARLEMERDLKAGRLPALVGTSSLELGIDIGSVDLVVQLQSPKGVARGLQRVGRSGHLVGETSTGRIFPTHREDVVESAVIAAGMLAGDVEPTRTPRLPLDVLAQQIVAMVSVEDWAVDDLHDLLRQAYPYEDLTVAVLRNVIEMLSGRYPASAHASLRPRLSWDRGNDRLYALPGARLLATTNGGTIPDRGMFGAYLADGRTRIGELDEEFVFETRVGDTFMLGSQVWRVVDIDEDRVLVAEAPGAFARMPFWHGDLPWRPYSLGLRVGAFRREMAERLRRLQARTGAARLGDLRALATDPLIGAGIAAAAALETDRLRREYALDESSAWQVLDHVGGQLDRLGTVSSDRTVVVEVFDDAVGDPRMAVHSPFGGRVNGPWSIALAAALRERTGVEVEAQADDDGILLRFPEADAEFPLDLVADMGPDEARRRILQGLPESAVFGAQFRMNAGRALLLPGLRGGRRTPFWLQRLRARDLLQAVRGFADFPLLLETYRDCVEDVMDLPHLEEVLGRIQTGEIEVVPIETLVPSSLAQGMLWRFASVHLYEWDAPKVERQLQTMAADPRLLQDILREVTLDDLLRPEAVSEVEDRVARVAPGWRARTREELAGVLLELGDLSTDEAAARSEGDAGAWLTELAEQGRVVATSWRSSADSGGPGASDDIWVPVEYVDEYRTALRAPAEVAPPGDAPGGSASRTAGRPPGAGPSSTGAGGAASDALDSAVDAARRTILERFVAHAGIVTEAAVRARYPFLPAQWVAGELDRMVGSRVVARGWFTPSRRRGRPTGTQEFVSVRTLEQMHRRTLTLLRNEVRPVSLAAYADVLARWQHLHPETRRRGEGSLIETLRQLRAAPVMGVVWERDVLPLRVDRYLPAELDALTLSGELVWVVSGAADPRRARVRFFFRGEGGAFLDPAATDLGGLSEDARLVYGFLRDEGASFVADIQAGLGRAPATVSAALLELVLRGLISNDSMVALRRVLHGDLSSSGPPPSSAPGDELSRRLEERRAARGIGSGRHPGLIPRPSRTRLRAAEQKVRRRLEAEAPLSLPGRWAVVDRAGVLGPCLPVEERALRQARLLLERHVVVTRAAVSQEEGAWDWPSIVAQLQRLELRGEVRRGYFVRGLPGVQFAVPTAVERLRAAPPPAAAPGAAAIDELEEAVVVMSACDPANIYGSRESAGDGLVTSSGGELVFARVPSTWVVLHRGLPILVAEDTGTRISTLRGASGETLTAALRALCGHLAGSLNRITVRSWDGGAPTAPPGRPLLEAAGFFADGLGMTWERPV